MTTTEKNPSKRKNPHEPTFSSLVFDTTPISFYKTPSLSSRERPVWNPPSGLSARESNNSSPASIVSAMAPVFDCLSSEQSTPTAPKKHRPDESNPFVVSSSTSSSLSPPPVFQLSPFSPSEQSQQSHLLASSRPSKSSKSSPEPLLFPNRYKVAVPHNEYCILGTIYKKIKSAPPEVLQWFDSLGRDSKNKHKEYESLRALTGCGKKTCMDAIRVANSEIQIPLSSGRTGRPKMTVDEEDGKLILQVVEEINKEGSASSIQEVKRRLYEQHKVLYSKRTLNRRLLALGCFWGAGTRIHKNHDTEANVNYRRMYIERCLANLVNILKSKKQLTIPRHPEVFLDESYCHLDHTNSHRWVIPGHTIQEPGHSQLLVIFAAFVVWYDKKDRELKAKFVDNSVYIWPALGKAHTKNGASSQNAEIWSNVPEFIKNAKIIAPTHDYHGNFSSEIFDSIFTEICKNLINMGLNQCRIHLDGASYHFHKNLSKPGGKGNIKDLAEWCNREEIKDWMVKNNISLPNKKLQKADYQAVLQAYTNAATWTIYDIAKNNGGHIIRKTPPYHCELQPIERIWACIKNKIASITTGAYTAVALKRALEILFASIPQSTFLSVWRRSIDRCIQYQEEDKDEWDEGEKHISTEVNKNSAVDGRVPTKFKSKTLHPRFDNLVHHNQHKQEDASFDAEAQLGDLSEQMWQWTLNSVVNDYIHLDSTPNRCNNDDEAGEEFLLEEEDSVWEDEVEQEYTQRNCHVMSIASMLN